MVTKSIHRQRKYSVPTIAMHVDAVCVFAWTRWYAALRSVFPIMMLFEGHLMHMAEIMWNILRRHNPQKHGWMVSLSTRLFMDRP